MLLLVALLLIARVGGQETDAEGDAGGDAAADDYVAEEECFAGGEDGVSYKAMLQWDTDMSYETLTAEQGCETKLQEMVDALIGRHGPPDEHNIKLQMCSSECDILTRNVADLIRQSRCTCSELEKVFPYHALPKGHTQKGPGPYVHRKLPANWCERNPLFYLHRLTGMLAVSNKDVIIGDDGGDNEPPPGAKLPIMQINSKPCKTAACEGELIYSKVAYHWYHAAMYNMIELDKNDMFDKHCSTMECQWSAYYFKYCRCDTAYEGTPGELWCGWSGATRTAGMHWGVQLLVLLLAAAAAQVWS